MKKSLNGITVEMTAEEEKEFLAGLPSDSEIAANKLVVLRDERNAKLAECDWTQTADSSLSDAEKTAWVTYRTALKDITKTYQSTEDDGFSWPEKP